MGVLTRRFADGWVSRVPWVLLGRLGDRLVAVARETVQPSHASLWLRPEIAPKNQPTD